MRQFWKSVKHFEPWEFEDPDGEHMSIKLISPLDDFREIIGRKVIVHRPGGGFATSGHKDNSLHYSGQAADVHVEGMGLVEQFLMASRVMGFGGIGVYLDWNNPGLHLEGPSRIWRHTWGWAKDTGYVALDSAFLKKCLDREAEKRDNAEGD